MNPILIAAALFIIWNIAVFAVYAADKRRARRNARRISERTLITMAFAMGGIGALVGMHIMRHKTKHMKFIVLVPLAVIVNAAMVWGIVWLTGFRF